jgi:signal peptidase II
MKTIKHSPFLTWTALVAPFIIDRITKAFALRTLTPTPLPVCPGINIMISWNRGVSWGMLSSEHATGFWILTALIASLIGALVWYAQWGMRNGKSVIGEMLVIGGALSNLFDRFMYKAVLDFIEFYAGNYHFPVLNIADACIVIGVSIILIQNWREPHA